MCSFSDCSDIISSSEFTKLHLTFRHRILAQTRRLLMPWVQQQEILGVDCFCQTHYYQSAKRALKSFAGHSNKSDQAFSCLVYLCSVQLICFSALTAPFCLSFYLDLVKTPTGALIWSFLKPMVFGKILYTPDTPETRAIMGKVCLCLQYIRICPLKRILICV